jgi:hypothetical protein
MVYVRGEKVAQANLISDCRTQRLCSQLTTTSTIMVTVATPTTEKEKWRRKKGRKLLVKGSSPGNIVKTTVPVRATLLT